MKKLFQALDAGSIPSLYRLLASNALADLAHLSSDSLLFGQTDSPRFLPGKKTPPEGRFTGVFDGSLPVEARHINPAISLVVEGKLQTSIGGNLFEVQAGDWLVFTPFVSHLEFHLPSRVPYRVLWFRVRGDDLFFAESSYSRKAGFCLSLYVPLEKTSSGILREVYQILQHPGQDQRSLQLRLLHLVSWGLDTLSADMHQASIPLHPLICRILEILDSPESVSLSVSQLANQVGLSLSYLSSLFRRQTGQTLSTAIQRKRVEHACRYLSETSMPVKEIANLLGFSTLQHFSHMVHRFTGISPRAFRQYSIQKSGS